MNRVLDGILRTAFETRGRWRCPQLPQSLMWKRPRGRQGYQAPTARPGPLGNLVPDPKTSKNSETDGPGGRPISGLLMGPTELDQLWLRPHGYLITSLSSSSRSE